MASAERRSRDRSSGERGGRIGRRGGKLRALETRLRELKSVMVATPAVWIRRFLRHGASRAGERMLAVLADSPSLARRDLEQARAFAQSLGMPLEIIATRNWTGRSTRARRQSLLPLQGRAFRVMEKLGAKRGFEYMPMA